ncbi:PqqD family peptide modification chaperone [Arthrobacter sp. ISL-95]|uniref:PqqD family peptide modification chaperone n=1 Tax=Arthrobacter sp. ISL-95 TaxID=2819116 RepID=UPI001BE5B270|nr:PqqD family peptide modification chaperone [Arthrobacter sp. ISL-95]MBT2588233.1 PqqD family peptide modification chaperone [Arthrobacter sp. ISL-95]
MDKEKRSFEFLYLARLHRRKRPTVLVEAAAMLATTCDKHIEVAFVGPDEGEESKVRRQIQATGTSDWITIEGPLTPGSTLDRMRRASVYVLPSVDEPFPMSVLEAMSVGVPVIVTDSCGLAPFIAESGAGIVANSSVEALSAAMRRFVEEPGLRASAAAAAVELARERFSMYAVTSQLEDVYQSLTSYSVRQPRSSMEQMVKGPVGLPLATDKVAGDYAESSQQRHGCTKENPFWHRAKAVAEVPALGEERLVVLNLERGLPLVLQGSAASIWELIDGTRTETDILKELANAYSGPDEPSVAEQVSNFLAGLSFHGLAESCDSPPAGPPD